MPIDEQRIKFVFQKLDRQLAKLTHKPQPGNVHQFRTYSRRLQALLEELSPQLSRNDKKLLKLLARLRRRAGRVRDLDVQIAALRSLKIPQEPRRKTQLLHILSEQRVRREKKLDQALDKETIRSLRKRLKKTAAKYRSPKDVQPLEVARHRLEEVSRPQSVLSEEVLHQYRIAGKRVRYVTELAGKNSDAQPFVQSLKGMQDALGDWHDWLLLTQSAEKIFPDAQDSALLAALRNITGAKYRHALQVVSEMRATLFPKSSGAELKMPTRPSSSAAGAKAGEPLLERAATA